MSGGDGGRTTGSGGSSASVRLAMRVYGVAARLLPAEFRAEFGAELAECFGAIASESRERSRRAVASVTVRAIVDLVTRAPLEHLSAARAGALAPGGGLAGVWQDVRHGARRLRRRPSFTLSSGLTLALGIAAVTSVFSLVHGVVLSPLRYPDSDALVQVDHGAVHLGMEGRLGVTYGFYRFYEERVRTAESMAMYSWLDRTLTGVGDPVTLSGIRATPPLATVLGISPALGRWFTSADVEAGAEPVVVLSHELWRTRLGGDPAIIGRTVQLEGIPTTVVGVARRDFAFPSPDAEFWIPRAVPATGVGGWNDMAVARLAPGASPEELEREMAALLPLLREATDDPARVESYLDEAGIFPRVVTLKESVVGDVRPTLWILMGTVAFVLLIALANVGNLFLVRSEETQRETALRSALGAGRGRLLRGHLAETLILAAGAGILGVWMAYVAVGVLRERAPVNVPRVEEIGLDPVVLGVAVALVLLTALILGAVPTLRSGNELSGALKEGTARSTAGRARLRGRNVLVAVQMALAMVLLISSGLLFRTFDELRAVDPGFTERQALTFRLGLPQPSYPTGADAVRFHRDLLPRLEAVPGVESAAAVAHCLPLTPSMCWGEALEAEGFPTPEGEAPPVTGLRMATPGYFETLGIPVRGRTFTLADESGEAPVAIISEATAEAYFPGGDAIGRRLRFDSDGAWYTVVGIARDVRARIETTEFLRTMYLPMLPAADGPPPHSVSYVISTLVPPTSIVEPVRRIIADMDPALPLGEVETLADRIGRATAPAAFALTLIGLASIIALLLGAVGVYAVVAYAVSRRTAEIGVRMALGAARGDVRRMVVRQGGAVVAAGIGIGLVAALALTRLMRGMLYGVSPSDPVSYVVLTVVMIAVAALALYLPARRASQVSPLEALRAE